MTYHSPKGADGDHIDVFFGPHKKAPYVYVIDQIDPDTKKFDEHKIMACFGNEKQAVETYKKAFSDGKGHARIGHVREMTIGELKHWMGNGDTKRPIRNHQGVSR